MSVLFSFVRIGFDVVLFVLLFLVIGRLSGAIEKLCTVSVAADIYKTYVHILYI